MATVMAMGRRTEEISGIDRAIIIGFGIEITTIIFVAPVVTTTTPTDTSVVFIIRSLLWVRVLINLGLLLRQQTPLRWLRRLLAMDWLGRFYSRWMHPQLRV
jgi:hypothetical protein